MLCIRRYVYILLNHLVTFDNGKVKLEYVDTENYKVIITAKLGTWIGIGYGNGMINTDMNIAEFIDNTKYTIKDCYSTGYSAPTEDTLLGGTNDLKDIEYSLDDNGNGIITFNRALNTGDPYDQEIIVDKPQNIVLAWGQGTLQYHGGNYKKLSMTVSEGGDDPVVKEFDFFALHGIILIVLWVAFNFVGYIASRFMRHHKWGMWLHWAGSGSTALISIGVISASIKYGNYYSFNL